MIVVKNAEEALLKELKSRREIDPTCRCLYWRAGLLGERRDQWLSPFLERLDNILLSDPGQAYICHDGDVFVIARTLTNKGLSSLVSHLSTKLGPAPAPHNGQGLADLFEIGMDIERLSTLCDKKIEHKKALEKMNADKKKTELAPVSREKTLREINDGLIATVNKRRLERDVPEIMVVEDDAFSQKLVSNALGGKYSLSISGDGQGAIMAYVAKAPDVLFLDIGLPDMDGHAVLERVFKIDPEAYVVMFSGNGNKENIMRAVELGAKGFVGKPFTKEKLFQYIEKSPFIQARHNREVAHGHSAH